VGGWNTRDALAAMPPEDAVVLDNIFPGLGSCKTRGGASAYATTLGGSVKTLAEFNAGSLRKFIAAANGKIWNISASGAGVSLATGFTSDIWDWAQFDDASGRRAWRSSTARIFLRSTTAPPSRPLTISGTGLTPANLNGVHIFRSRSFFWDNRTQDFWYSATNALGGTMTKFPLGRVQGTGGNLIAMVTWSRDSGTGLDDLAVFILSSGDILIYAGTNPGDANAWQIVGRYAVAAPIDKRACARSARMSSSRRRRAMSRLRRCSRRVATTRRRARSLEDPPERARCDGGRWNPLRLAARALPEGQLHRGERAGLHDRVSAARDEHRDEGVVSFHRPAGYVLGPLQRCAVLWKSRWHGGACGQRHIGSWLDHSLQRADRMELPREQSSSQAAIRAAPLSSPAGGDTRIHSRRGFRLPAAADVHQSDDQRFQRRHVAHMGSKPMEYPTVGRRGLRFSNQWCSASPIQDMRAASVCSCRSRLNVWNGLQRPISSKPGGVL
jgi:hypothetical protein